MDHEDTIKARRRRGAVAAWSAVGVAAAAALGFVLATSGEHAHGIAAASAFLSQRAVPSVRATGGRSNRDAASGASEPDDPSRARPILLADFGTQRASRDARQVGNWAFYTGDNDGHAVVIVDKRQAKAFVFDPSGSLMGAAPVLLGSAIGDYTVPGVGDKPIADVKPEERTTPAGRFVAQIGTSSSAKEDVVWVDFDAAVSMHRVRPWVKAERRLERLASPTPKDNRISYGCINMPPQFYEQVLSPAVRQWGAIIYVLPETSTAAQVFGSYDIRNADVLAMFVRRDK